MELIYIFILFYAMNIIIVIIMLLAKSYYSSFKINTFSLGNIKINMDSFYYSQIIIFHILIIHVFSCQVIIIDFIFILHKIVILIVVIIIILLIIEIIIIIITIHIFFLIIVRIIHFLETVSLLLM